jgi:hypothetical protein
MANKKISELTAAGALTGTELVEVVQGGVNKQTTTQDIADLSGGAVASVNGATGVVVLDAGDIGVTPAGTIAATDVQAALVELDTEKAPLASPALTGTPTAPTAAPGTNTTQLATTAFVTKERNDVTLANGVVTIDWSAGDIQNLTITEAKVITTISNPVVGETIILIIPGTNSLSFSTITAVVEGSYNAGEENRIFILCTKVSGGAEYRITFDNSLSNAFDVDSAAFSALTDGATVSWAVSSSEIFSNRTLTIAGNRTFGAPSGMPDGCVGTCWVTASGGTRTINIPAGTSHKLKGVGDDTSKTITIPSGETYVISWQYNSAAGIWMWWFVD